MDNISGLIGVLSALGDVRDHEVDVIRRVLGRDGNCAAPGEIFIADNRASLKPMSRPSNLTWGTAKAT